MCVRYVAFTLFLSVFHLFHRKNLVLLSTISRFGAFTNEYSLISKDTVNL